MTILSSCSDLNIKVFIADDSLIVREHLVTMLDELAGIEITGQAGTVTEAVTAIQTLHPDVVILDIRMPGGSLNLSGCDSSSCAIVSQIVGTPST